MKPKISKKIGPGKDWDLDKNCPVGNNKIRKICPKSDWQGKPCVDHEGHLGACHSVWGSSYYDQR